MLSIIIHVLSFVLLFIDLSYLSMKCTKNVKFDDVDNRTLSVYAYKSKFAF